MIVISILNIIFPNLFLVVRGMYNDVLEEKKRVEID
jgi:hypothetical protein